MADTYDTVVIGDGLLAVATAWALTEAEGRGRIAVLVPTHLGAGWDPVIDGRLHALRLPVEVAELVPRSSSRLRGWADLLGLQPPRVRGGHLVVATSTASWAGLRAAAERVPACRPLDVHERAELLTGLASESCLAGWHEPLATTMDLPGMIFRLAEAAAAAGVDLVDDAAILGVRAAPDGFEVTSTAGTTRARTVVDADPCLAVSRAAGLAGTLVATSHQRLTTTALTPLLELGVTVDDIEVAQRPTGEVELVVPTADPLVAAGLSAAADAVRTVLSVLPELAGAEVIDCRSVREAVSVDGLPVVGALADGLWTCGALGRHRLPLLPLLAEALAAAVTTGDLPTELAAFAPRSVGARPIVVPSALRWGCPTCGSRSRNEFVLVGDRPVHAGGCGRPLGGDVGAEQVIDLREPAPSPGRVAPPGAHLLVDAAVGPAGEPTGPRS